MKVSYLEDLLTEECRAHNLPIPLREVRFHSERKWRWDLCFPQAHLAIEVEGGTWVNGRHSRGTGFIRDCQKHNEGTLLGWRILRFTRDQVMDGSALETIKRALGVGT